MCAHRMHGPERPYTGALKGALVAHSASGWIARIFLASGPAEYCGRVYGGSRWIDSLVTLGTPHTSTEGIAFRQASHRTGPAACSCSRDTSAHRNISFVNKSFPGAYEPGVRYTCVGSASVAGKAFGPNNAVQDLAYQSYVLCCGRGDVMGDGIVPLECAHALEGAIAVEVQAEHSPLVEKQGRGLLGGGPTGAPSARYKGPWSSNRGAHGSCLHAQGRQWYGSKGVLEKWVEQLALGPGEAAMPAAAGGRDLA